MHALLVNLHSISESYSLILPSHWKRFSNQMYAIRALTGALVFIVRLARPQRFGLFKRILDVDSKHIPALLFCAFVKSQQGDIMATRSFHLLSESFSPSGKILFTKMRKTGWERILKKDTPPRRVVHLKPIAPSSGGPSAATCCAWTR